MWENCWSLARVYLGMSDGEFYRLTPRQLHLLMDQHRLRVEHQELLTAVIAQEVHRAGFGATKRRPLTDFMPSRWEEKPKVGTRINRKRVAMDVRAFFSEQMRLTDGR